MGRGVDILIAISKKHLHYSLFTKRIIAIEAQLYFLGLVGLYILKFRKLSNQAWTYQVFRYVLEHVSGPIYTIINTRCIRINPGKLKFILVKFSPDSGRLHRKYAKENQTLLTFLTTDTLSGLPCLYECKYEAYYNLFSYTVNLPG